MQRFPSLDYAPAETRMVLRDRLQSYFAREVRSMGPGIDGPELADEDALHLLEHLEIEFGNELSRIASSYEAARDANGGEPSLEDRIAAGWARVVWGRVHVPREIHSALIRSGRNIGAFRVVLEQRFDDRRRLVEAETLEPNLLKTGQAIEQGKLEPSGLNCRTPVWVAARLWDRSVRSGDDDRDLRRWIDLWILFNSPELAPSKVWNAHDGWRLRLAALNRLETDRALEGWSETRDRFVRELGVIHNRSLVEARSLLPLLPETLVERAQWLENNSVIRLTYESQAGCGELLHLLSLLVADIDQWNAFPSPHSIRERILDLAVSRPDVLFQLTHILQHRPRLLSDILLDPRTAAWGCWLISKWRVGNSAYDGQTVRNGDEQARIDAFEDAVAILAWQLAKGAVAPAEVGALLAALHRAGPAGFIDDCNEQEPLRMRLRKVLINQSGESLKAIVDALPAHADALQRIGSRFAASLELVALGDIADQVDPAAIVSSYIDGLTKDVLSPSVQRIGVQSASALLATASRTPKLRQQFLRAIDIQGELAKAQEPEANSFTVRDNAARGLRAHIRILCRAIVGHAGPAPGDLADALVAAVRSGAMSHEEKGRVPAFAPRFERNTVAVERDRPIAADLAAALWTLSDDERQRLLTAILETDEPMVLAQLLPISPPITRERISRRIEALPPTEAGSIYSLTEVQARIDELLSAGATEAAAKFMEEEESLLTSGKVRGREVLRFRSQLRMLFARNGWDEILATQAPPDLNLVEMEEANEVLRFYRGLTLLVRPDQRDPASAEAIFDELHRRRPNNVTYVLNKIAAQVGGLLPADMFGRLEGAGARRARQVLAECDTFSQGLDSLNHKLLAANQAVLHLALGEPDRALALLPLTAFEPLDERLQAYRAIALHRLHRSDEAISLLRTAEDVFGKTEMLEAAWAHISAGTPFVGSAAVAADGDPVVAVRQAYLGLHTLDPIQQARVLNSASDPLSAFLIDQVRGAAASIVALLPMMTVIEIDGSEDDINSVIRQLLLSRLEFLRWSVLDQSRGGFTPKLNPGERDITVERGSTTLTVIEAVVANSPAWWETVQGNLRRHFQKLLAYAPCRLFFHLTYVYDQDLQSIIDRLRVIAANDAPSGYEYVGAAEIELTDTRPHGFIAQYRDGLGTLQVVFLALDMGQKLPKAAAAASERPKKTSPMSRSS